MKFRSYIIEFCCGGLFVTYTAIPVVGAYLTTYCAIISVVGPIYLSSVVYFFSTLDDTLVDKSNLVSYLFSSNLQGYT
ncbi:hypothetical protein Avbf_12580 [Armadillidium vulgare]|nr:hypothetical protein Avbf_12580 [Armadillidium vulgare]